MGKSAQQSFEKIHWRHRYSHGGSLRRERVGRLARPLSTRDSIHLVFKANREVIRGGFRQSRRFALIHHLVQKYKFKFYVKVEQISIIQGDHMHLLIRTTRRSNYQSFFRVVAGQIAQQFEKEGLLTASFTTAGRTPSAPTTSNPPIPRASGVSVTSQRASVQNMNVTDTPKVLAKAQILRGERASNVAVTGTPKHHKLAGTPQIAGEDDSPQNHYQMEVIGSANEACVSKMEAVAPTNTTSVAEVDSTKGGSADKSMKPRKLWKYRPFTRVVKSYRAYMTVRNYIQLNEKEALKEIPYQKRRLKSLATSEWQALWS